MGQSKYGWGGGHRSGVATTNGVLRDENGGQIESFQAKLGDCLVHSVVLWDVHYVMKMV